MVLEKLFTIDGEINGSGTVLFAWQPNGNYIASTGTNRRVVIVDRQGKSVHQLQLEGSTPAIMLKWDPTGEILAIIQAKSSNITFFSTVKKKFEVMDMGMKDITFLAWNHTESLLAMGNSKGQLMIYDKQTSKKYPINGTHTKKVIDGAWNPAGLLATIGEDRNVAISDKDGKVIDLTTLKAVGTQVIFGSLQNDDASSNLCAVNVGGKMLHTMNISQKNSIQELSFDPECGPIVAIKMLADGYIFIGFGSGYVQVISVKETNDMSSSFRSHREKLYNVAYCRNVRKGCSIGDNTIRTFEINEDKINEQGAEKYELDRTIAKMENVEWTDDGQILSVSNDKGFVMSFLTKVPTLIDTCGREMIYLSSIREMTVKSVETDKIICKIPIELEPTFVAVGEGSAACGMNNQVFFFTHSKGKPKSVGNRSYNGVVDKLKLNSNFSVALVEGKGILHPISSEEPHGHRQQVTLIDKIQNAVTCISITENYVCYGSQGGMIGIFSLVNYETIVEYKHNGGGIRHLSPNPTATRVAFIDDINGGYILNPISEVTTTIENFNSNTKKIIWDISEYGMIAGIDSKFITTYVYTPNSRNGPQCEPIYVMDLKTLKATMKPLVTPLPPRHSPMLLRKGILSCQTTSGTIATVHLESAKGVYQFNPKIDQMEVFLRIVHSNRLEQALAETKIKSQLSYLATRALHLLDIEMAIIVYRRLDQPTIVMCLEKIRHIREKNILLGHVAMISGNFNDAQNFFARSSRPILALEMRRDLLQWDHALHLAKSMANDQVPLISKEYAQQLEFRGEFSKALEHYQEGRMPVAEGHQGAELDALIAVIDAHNKVCDSGAARCMIRIGSIREGLQLAQRLNDSATALECAKILEMMNQFEDAGTMYELAGFYEKAASIYINETKNLKAACRLLPNIKSRNTLVMYAHAKETQEQAYTEAEQVYTMAEDWDNVVRIKVEHQNDLHGAYVIVRKTHSADAAIMVANMCRQKKEFGPAVEFMVMGKKYRDAFELAQSTGCITNYEEALLAQVPLKDGVAPDANIDDFLVIAKYYDEKKKPMQAGMYYQVVGNFSNSLARYIEVNDEEAINKAVAVVGKARSDLLTNKLIDFLMGEIDGEPKDPSYIFKLYMALGNFEKAAKTSVLIATKEQELGNYHGAHKALLGTALVLQEKGFRIPSDLRRSLMLVHSYLIVKHIAKTLDDMDNATRMLLRVARNIKKFPLHMTTILTSTVLQSVKVGFNASAHEYACQIIQDDALRAELNEKHRKKVESLVRKRNKDAIIDPTESLSPCPFCSVPVAETSLECASCKNTLPFCIVTGKHLVLEEWTSCPNCQFPALIKPFVKLLQDVPQCPMCDKYVDPNSLEVAKNPDVKAFV